MPNHYVLRIRGAQDELPPEEPEPDVLFNPGDFANIAALLAWAPFDQAEVRNSAQMSLDSTVSLGGIFTKSLRYDWPNNGSVQTDHQIGPGPLMFTGQQKVAIEHWVRYGSTFTVDHGIDPGTVGTEYKHGTAGQWGSTGRYNVLEMQPGRYVCGWPDEVFICRNVVPSDLWNESNVRYRFVLGRGASAIVRCFVNDTQLEILESSGPDVWVDELTGFTVTGGHTAVDYFQFGANMNQGPAISDMKHWTLACSVWYSNNLPSWAA